MAGAYSSGCGGPEYGWNEDASIWVGGEIPQRALPARVLDHTDLIYDSAARYNLPANYIAGIMGLESGGDPTAGSPAGAMGLMQLIQSTANQMAGRKLSSEEVYDPETNVDLGCKLLRQLWDKYNADPIKMAFAYNAGKARCGSGCVRDYSDKAGGMPCIASCTPNRFGLVADCTGGHTLDYGTRVVEYANDALLSGAVRSERGSFETSQDHRFRNAFWGSLAVGGVALLAINHERVSAWLDRA